MHRSDEASTSYETERCDATQCSCSFSLAGYGCSYNRSFSHPTCVWCARTDQAHCLRPQPGADFIQSFVTCNFDLVVPLCGIELDMLYHLPFEYSAGRPAGYPDTPVAGVPMVYSKLTAPGARRSPSKMQLPPRIHRIGRGIGMSIAYAKVFVTFLICLRC